MGLDNIIASQLNCFLPEKIPAESDNTNLRGSIILWLTICLFRTQSSYVSILLNYC